MSKVIKHTAKRVSTPGSTPVYEYRGVRVVNSAGSSYGRGWIYDLGDKAKYTTTLESAKFFIDLYIDKGML